MKLLLDQNLSRKLPRMLTDIFPGSEQLYEIGMDRCDDFQVWEHARANHFTLVSQDVDFANLSTLKGHPPKLIWLRCGNQPTAVVEKVLRRNLGVILQFEADPHTSFIELFR